MRKTEDVLAGYRSAGGFDPGWWLIARHADCDVGCLLLADQPGQDRMELLYMGLAAGARGHGLGDSLPVMPSGLPGELGRTRLVLAVDAANTPAIRTYEAVGFETWQRRRMYAREFDYGVGNDSGQRHGLGRGHFFRRGFAARHVRTAGLIRPIGTGIDPVVLGVQLHRAQVEVEIQPLRFVVDPGVQQIVLRVQETGQRLIDVASRGGAEDAHFARFRRLLQAKLHHVDLIDGHVDGRPANSKSSS